MLERFNLLHDQNPEWAVRRRRLPSVWAGCIDAEDDEELYVDEHEKFCLSLFFDFDVCEILYRSAYLRDIGPLYRVHKGQNRKVMIGKKFFM